MPCAHDIRDRSLGIASYMNPHGYFFVCGCVSFMQLLYMTWLYILCIIIACIQYSYLVQVLVDLFPVEFWIELKWMNRTQYSKKCTVYWVSPMRKSFYNIICNKS
jgi:hypothetical protein